METKIHHMVLQCQLDMPIMMKKLIGLQSFFICVTKKFNSHARSLRHVCKHCHFAGKYLTVAHSIYNLRYSIPRKISVYFITGLIMFFVL